MWATRQFRRLRGEAKVLDGQPVDSSQLRHSLTPSGIWVDFQAVLDTEVEHVLAEPRDKQQCWTYSK